MKILLLGFITLVFVSHVSPAPHVALLKIVNEARRAFAKENNIANMHFLKYDYALLLLSDYLVFACPSKKELMDDHQHFQYEIHPFILNATATKSETVQVAKEIFMNPAQSRIGWGEKAAKCRRTDYNMIFALGPETKKIVKYGPPGSQCGDKIAKDGLCVEEETLNNSY